MNEEKIVFYNGDLSDDSYSEMVSNCTILAIDTETTGLNAIVDDLSIIQVFDGERYHIIRHQKEIDAKNIKALLTSASIIKIFHHAPFDLSFIVHHLGVSGFVSNVRCTKIAFKILNGPNVKSSLKDLTQAYLGFSLDKTQQISNWSNTKLTEEQIKYAINDVRYLVKLWSKLEQDLKNGELLEIANKCFEFLPIQAKMKNRGFENIFSY